MSSFNRILSGVALLAAFFHITLIFDAGLLAKFGRSPVEFTPTNIALNSLMIATSLMGVEFSRAYILRTYGRRKPIPSLVLMSLLYSPTISFISMFFYSTKPLEIVEFLGSKFLPALAMNMLACYLALLAGPIASLAYTAPLQAYQWFSPILPDLSWSFESLIGVLAPTISLIAIDYSIPTSLLRRAGLNVKTEGKWMKENSKSSIGLILTVVIFLLAVWFSAGLLGVFPSVIMSGSMQPALNVGDIAILIKVPANKILLGDVIQYVSREGAVLHRVVTIKQGYFITKGDANNVIDYAPVYPSQIKGKLLFIIPKLGWISIYIKIMIFSIIRFIYCNPINLIGFTIIFSFIFSYFIYNYSMKKKKFGKWR